MSVVGAIAHKPAMMTLIKAFNRWQKEEPWDGDRSHAQILMHRVFATVGMESQEQARLPEPAGVTFIMSLRLLSPTSVPLADRTCGICTQPYRDMADQGDACVATRLPCNHIFGSRCTIRWMNPTKGDKNSCPYCRREFFPRFPDYDTVEGLQARVDFFDWGAQNLGSRSRPGQKWMLREWTKMIVSDRLGEAKREYCIESQIVMRLLKSEGVSDAELNAPLTAKSPRPLMELHLWKTMIDAIGFQVHISNLTEEIEVARAQAATTQEVMLQLDQDFEEREAVEEEEDDRMMGELVLPDGGDHDVESY